MEHDEKTIKKGMQHNPVKLTVYQTDSKARASKRPQTPFMILLYRHCMNTFSAICCQPAKTAA